MGDMFSPTIDDAMGTGLGLWGTGEGGGGTGQGVGLDHVNTLGGGGGGTGPSGFGPGDKSGIGIGHGPGGGGHVAKAPILRNPTIESNGRLPAEVIQRIVRQNFGRFRLCYEAGLRGNPSLIRPHRDQVRHRPRRRGDAVLGRRLGSPGPERRRLRRPQLQLALVPRARRRRRDGHLPDHPLAGPVSAIAEARAAGQGAGQSSHLGLFRPPR